MGDKDEDEWRKAAEHCRHMANVARHADTKRQWLVLAQSWLRMIRPGNRTASETCEAERSAPAPAQEESKSPH
jgi:hypothetical protein